MRGACRPGGKNYRGWRRGAPRMARGAIGNNGRRGNGLRRKRRMLNGGTRAWCRKSLPSDSTEGGHRKRSCSNKTLVSRFRNSPAFAAIT